MSNINEKDEAFWEAMEKLDRRLDDRKRRKLDFIGVDVGEPTKK